MTHKDDRRVDVEVALRHQPGEPGGFRVIFERSGPARKTRLATVYVKGGESPTVARFGRAPAAEAVGPPRADFERRAVAVVQNLAEAFAPA